MLILLSPAKNLDWSDPPEALARTAPQLAKDTKALAKAAKALKPADLQRLMGLSEKLARLNHERFQAFDPDADPSVGKQAALAFNGDVYQGLSAKTLKPADLMWAQDRVRILSGLYGLLRPLDAIQPYRLEMGTKLPTSRGEDLYDFWGDRIAKAINAEKPSAILNLASDEYFSAIPKGALKAPVVTLTFKDVKDGKARAFFLFITRARGAFARHCIVNRLTSPEALKGAVVDGYRFDPATSDARGWTFSRPQPPPVAVTRAPTSVSGTGFHSA